MDDKKHDKNKDLPAWERASRDKGQSQSRTHVYVCVCFYVRGGDKRYLLITL